MVLACFNSETHQNTVMWGIPEYHWHSGIALEKP